jgi:hypothetical protein
VPYALDDRNFQAVLEVTALEDRRDVVPQIALEPTCSPARPGAADDEVKPVDDVRSHRLGCANTSLAAVGRTCC